MPRLAILTLTALLLLAGCTSSDGKSDGQEARRQGLVEALGHQDHVSAEGPGLRRDLEERRDPA